ncbi:hypothetical protein Ahy_A03g014027 isoform E [Arachis hypogaea]|uniref:Uncharacterized protein n=1 Tax=Arachis hypogaea TaxID=3818 RepID=A0A445DWT9_ARAHY|nr:hypothetical protein Ahy_A03g014027 isoform E [Arachis hypogaea]
MLFFLENPGLLSKFFPILP